MISSENLPITKIITGPIDVNTYFVPLDGNSLFITDPGGDAQIIRRTILDSHKTLKAILLTHGHFDHVLALSEIKKMFPEAFIMIHAADSCYLGKGGVPRHEYDLRSLNLGGLIPKIASLPDADVFLNDGDEPLCGWRVIHTAGHTAGSICLYNKNKGELISGDTLFRGSCGRTDLYGGNSLDMMKSLEKLSQLPGETKVFPGHGDETFISDEEFY